ncbi:voltage-gated potassium channel [Pseudobutyrivibrio sp. UC1225]|uniref:ion transporter n=1 Tax=Pseudobutyrivibrio sp. UC1225 TaxID=1798185 RepID=UPI0008E91D5F|nr:ion transporter [Pseudobutyrivibrio sp. UC1225]SFO35203.1 voltage-gated potassium channel [Pseudobutyrivibrio sp. UC1225]
MKKISKEHIFHVIQIGNKGDIASRAFDIFITVTILLNVAVMVLQTYEEFTPIFPILNVIAFVTILIFCVEYALRIWTADLLYPEVSRQKAIIKFLLSFDGVIDLFTILPFFFLSGFVAFRILRVIRIFHLFRINGQYDSFAVIFSVLKEKRNQITSSLVILMILMLASSIGIYYAEHEAQPKVFRNAFSGIWWSVSTLLTVGYGDIYPITTPGRIMAILTGFLGVGVVAIPTGILSAGFVEHYAKMKLMNNFARDEHIDLLTIHVTEGHCWNGLKVEEIGVPDHYLPAIITRDGESLIPVQDLTLKIGDTVVLAAEAYFSHTY